MTGQGGPLGSVYDRLGVKRYINAAATITAYGGSIMEPVVLQAMSEAAASYVDIVDLGRRAGDQIAAWTGNEAALVTNGAAAGIVLATAAVIAGDDPVARANLPQTDGRANQVVVCRAGAAHYDFAVRLGGGRRVSYGDDSRGTAEQLEAALSDQTAAILTFYYDQRMANQPALSDQIRIAHAHGLPLIVDAAAQLPPKANLWRLTGAGADLVIFSGGKGLRGPQSSGLMLGRRDLIERIRTLASPNEGVGRPMKVGKEEIIGLMTAVRIFLDQDEAATLADYERQVHQVVEAFHGDAAVDVVRGFPSEAGQPMPWAVVTPRPGALTTDAAGLAAQLKQGSPGVLVLSRDGQLQINPQTLLPGEIDTVIDRLRQVLAANRRLT